MLLEQICVMIVKPESDSYVDEEFDIEHYIGGCEQWSEIE